MKVEANANSIRLRKSPKLSEKGLRVNTYEHSKGGVCYGVTVNMWPFDNGVQYNSDISK